MTTARLCTVFAFALAFAAFTRPASAQITIEADQPAYEVTQELTVKISGPPGAPIFLLVDVAPGPVEFPIGTLEIGFSPIWFMVSLGTFPASGSITVHEAFSCRTAHVYGTELYLQAATKIDGVKVLSKGLHMAEMPGDCTDECTDSVVELGLQVKLENVLPLGTLHVDAWKAGDMSHSYGPAIDMDLNMEDVAIGVLDTPIFNSTGSLAISLLELEGDTLTIRFFINAELAGYPSLEGTTFLNVHYSWSDCRGTVQTDCLAPIKVGDVFGHFTVIKIIDGG